MPSTFSPLKIELIATGEQSGTWGVTTNTNLGTALEEAITGSADVSFSSADVTLTLTDTNATQSARNLRLNLTGTSGGARNLILGSGCQIEKLYLINNGLADAVTVKNTSGSGVAVPAGKTMFVYNNGTNVVDVTTHLSSLTLTTALPAASGGTGQSSYTTGDLLYASGATALSKLGIGTNGQALVVSGGALAWATASGTTTNSLTIATTGGAAAPATFNGSTAITIDYSTVGADQAGTAVALAIALG
jgi:hypothetical protein